MPVKCKYCGREIKTKKDLAVGLVLLSISPYHSVCYAQKLKETILLRRQVVNGKSGNFLAVLFPVFGIFFLLAVLSTGSLPPFVIVFIMVFIAMGPTIRLYSYYKYEKPLKD